MKIVILGGYGDTGERLARHLAATTKAEIVIAGRNAKKAVAAALVIGRETGTGERISGQVADAAMPDTLLRVCCGADLIIAASSSTEHVSNVASVALAVGADYLDTQLSIEI